ncbi:MAG TPA: 4Fe-4S binding protein, partial [Devosiaceae bacterium]|nr:4Fe-4S binding protein [Devosiaceae bacterium]
LLDRLTANYPEGTLGILLASTGRYNFQGVKYQNASSEYLLDRVEIKQGDTTYRFHREHYIRIGASRIAPNTGILVLSPDTGFDPLTSWTANLLVHSTAADGSVTSVAFPLEYQVPAAYVLLPEPQPEPLWVSIWRDASVDVAILGTALTVLTLIFVFQAQLARHRLVHQWMRAGFLVFTVVWLGYMSGAQLSMVHITNWVKAPFENLDIGFYLAEPLLVVLGLYVVVSLVLIGRGVFCGWLCPFGALQELSHKLGRVLGLPEWQPSWRMQKWLWLPKYGAAAVVVGTAFLVPEWSAAAQEVEPFKTAITSAFTRPLPYVAYAGLLIVISMFSERAFCRFLCPLGGMLAVLDRLHLLNLLKRRFECGSSCHLCERSCPIKAIAPSGRIETAECFQCLDCQVEYYDGKRCPPLSRQRKNRTRTAAGGLGEPVPVFAGSLPNPI